jgi:uncharacterized SAM-binding protein YcdF (DUF218 family)
VVVNGNRKSDVLRTLEAKGFEPGCHWYEDHLRILALLGVPRTKVLTISAEDVYDTISEAKVVGQRLLKGGVRRVLVVTSKYHTRRAGYVWRQLYGDRMEIRTVAAESDPFSEAGWWKEGRQIRWVLAEYGAWVYYFWKQSSRLR